MADIFLFREESDSGADIDTVQREEEEESPEEGLYCRLCGHQITSSRFAIEVNGGHTHTFFNPAGIVYEIRCFQAAQGCAPHGPPSSEFTWFAGHTWQLALCSVCAAHLGWFFSSAESGFYGLISRNLSS